MRILYLTQYFPPEVGATQNRAEAMARHWAAAGHDVTVITEVPNHPLGVIRPEYRGKLWTRERWEGVEVIRLWVRTSRRKDLRARLLFYGTYMVGATVAGVLLARGPFDVVFATSPPLLVGGAGLALARLRGAPLVFEVRDLWPESAVALDALHSRRARRWATRFEERCYRRAAGIVVVTQGIHDRLVERGIPREKLVLIPNGADVERFRFRPQGRERVRRELGATDDFVVAYVGVHGLAQGLTTLVEAAAQLRGESGWRFVFVGEGPRKNRARGAAEAYGLPNVTFLPECPHEDAADHLSAADAVWVPLRDLPLFRGALPSKMFDAWACGRPVVLGIEGEAREMLEGAKGGIAVAPEDPAALAAALRRLRASPADATAMGLAGRAFTQEHHSRTALAAQLLEWLEAVAQRAGGGGR